jgi:Tol biopolymer transport system component
MQACSSTPGSPSPLSSPLPLRERGRGWGTLIIKREIHKHSYLYGDLYLYDPKTKRETRLTEGARVYRAALFPDGQKVLLARYRWGDQGPVLSLFDLQTRQMQTLKEFPIHDYFIDSFAISSDGEQIALSIWRRGGFQDIYLLDLSPSPSPEEGGESPFPLGMEVRG